MKQKWTNCNKCCYIKFLSVFAYSVVVSVAAGKLRNMHKNMNFLIFKYNFTYFTV